MEKRDDIRYIFVQVKNTFFNHPAIYLIFLLFCVIPVFSYDVPLPEDEAAPALFSMDLWDEDVEFFIKGSWNASLSASWGFGISSERGIYQDSSHASLPVGFDFEQNPDITLSLWLFDQYFFETNYTEDFESSTFLLGYEGKKEEFLQSVRIGNTDVSMDSYAYWQVPDIPENGLGASAAFSMGSTSHEALLRYDPAETMTAVFQGDFEIEEEYLNPGAYLKSQYFYLPVTPVEDFSIYSEVSPDEGGTVYNGNDGQSYSIMDDSEYTLDAENGTLVLEEVPQNRILISFSGMEETLAFDDDLPWSAGTDDYTSETVTVDGTDCLLLYAASDFPILEAARYYRTALSLSEDESWSMKAWLVPLSDLDSSDTALSISYYDDGIFSVESSGFLPGSIYYAWPLADSDEAANLYGPERMTDQDEQTASLLIQTYTEVSSYQLIDPLEGSLNVTINGVSTTAYDLTSGGAIEFSGYIHPSDRIEVSYRTLSTSETGGDFLFGLGNRFEPLPGLNIEAGTGIRWNILSGTFSTESDQYPGSLLTSVKAEYETEGFSAGLEAGLSLSSSDTTGIFKVQGMDDGGLVFSIPEYGILPASLPPDYLSGKKGSLNFKDFHLYTTLGYSYLQDYTWDIPDNQIYTYEEGSRTGPYTVKATSDSKGGRFAVLEATLPENDSWAGATIPLLEDGYGVDLSSSTALNLTWKWNSDIPDNTLVCIDIGTLAEDSDGDGTLDEEQSAYSDGFTYNDPNTGETLSYGGSETDGSGDALSDYDGYLDSEDLNGNGFLDSEDSDHTVRFTFEPEDSSYPGTEWEYLRIAFSDDEREKLTSVNGIRIFLVNEGISEVEGTLFSGDLFFEGSCMLQSEPESSDAMEAGESWEGQLPSDELPENSLEGYFSEISETFHSDSSDQKIFRLSWDGDQGTAEWNDEWEMTTYSSPVVLNSYSEFAFYIRIPELTAGTDNRMIIGYTDGSGNGLTASFIPETFSEWKKITINLEDETIDGGDLTISDPLVSVTSGYYTVSTLKVGMSDTSGGLLFLDEFHLAESKTSLSGSTEVNFAYTTSDLDLTIGNFPVFGKLAASGRGFYQGSMFAAGTESSAVDSDSGNLYALGSSGVLSFDLLGTSIILDGDVTEFDDELTWSASHEITFPASSSPLSFTDRYSESIYGDEKEFSRSNEISISPLPLFNLSLTGEAVAYDYGDEADLLVRDWSAVVTSKAGKSVALSANAAIQHSADEWSMEQSDYFHQWLDGYTLLLPESSMEEDDRAGSASVSLAVDTSPLGGRLTGTGSYSTDTSDGEKQKNSSGGWQLGLDFSRKASTTGSWNFDIDYGRDFTWERDWDKLKFTEDAEAYFTEIGFMAYLYNSIPFYEIYSLGTESDFSTETEDLTLFSSRSYSPWYELTFSRPSGSYLRDLFLPSSVSFREKRSLDFSADELDDSLTTEISVRTGVINLLGSRGSLSLLKDFFETEEIRTVVTYSSEEVYSGDEESDEELEVTSYLFFRLSALNSLWLYNTFTWNFADSTIDNTGTFSWTRKLEELPEWKVLDKPELEEAGMQHTEDLAFGFESEPDEAEISSSILLTHETALVLPAGTIGAFGSLGVSASNTDGVSDWQFGVSVGLTANLSY